MRNVVRSVLPGVVPALVLVVLAPNPASAQEAATGTVLGRTRDAEGAAVYAVDIRLTRGDSLVRTAQTDRLGFFRMDRVPPGVYELRAGRLGFRELVRRVAVTAGGEARVDLVLEQAPVAVEGMSVEARRSRERRRFEEEAGVTVREIAGEDIKRIPGVAEADPLRAIGVLPGVVSTSDISADYHVRGGSGDQNLVLLDGVPVFSPFHLGGFFSVFNADMVDRVELQSGGFPAEYGGRVSSVLTLETDPGDGRFRVDGGVSLLATRVAVAGGVDPDLRRSAGLSSARWRVSARRSYFDVVLRPFFDFPYHLSDLQGVFQGWTSGGDRIDVSAYTGRDVLNLTSLDPEDFPLRIDWSWGNDLVGARWVHPHRRGGALRVSASVTRFGSGLRFPDFGDTDLRSAIHEATLGVSADVLPASGLRVTAGVRSDYFAYDNLARSGGTVFTGGKGSGWQLSGFGQAEWRSPSRWLVEAGLRLDGWRPGSGPPVTVLAPRLAAKRFFGDSHWAVKVAAGRYAQFVHSLRDEELPLGLDTWVLAGDRAPHLVSDQLQLGVEGYPDEAWEISLEAFARNFDGVAAFSTADNPNDPGDDVLAGEGRSWGADLFIRRRTRDVTGSLALSWLRTRRTFPDVLSPLEPRPTVTYPPVFDRRIDLDLVLRFPLPGGWLGGLRWSLGTGLPYTRPVGSYAHYQPRFVLRDGALEWSGGDDGGFGGYAVLLGDRNGARYPPYHRLDLSFRKEIRRSWGSLTPYVDILNVYNRKNVLFYFYEYDAEPPTRSGISMFPALPSVGLEVHFR